MKTLRLIRVNEGKIKKYKHAEWTRFNQEAGYLWRLKEFCYAAYFNDKLAGHFKIEIVGKVAKIDELLVAKKYRKLGIGEKLIKKCEEIARKKGCFKIKLFTSDHHKVALKFYKKQGYKKECELKNDLFHFNWYWLSKRLT